MSGAGAPEPLHLLGLRNLPHLLVTVLSRLRMAKCLCLNERLRGVGMIDELKTRLDRLTERIAEMRGYL